jgi:serine/threonine protein kinase
MAPIAWDELTLEKKLGEGASGVIHRAHWRPENKPVAVKIFRGGMTSDGLPEEEIAVCLAAGEHPNLIGALGNIAGHPDGGNGLVMPLVDPDFVSLAGPPDFQTCTRDVYPEDRRFSLSEILKMLTALSSAAAHLHERGIAHGDFYAHNILRNDSGDCLLGDFGAAAFYPREVEMERIEVRAFGCLLEELLERGDFTRDEEKIVAALGKLQKSCVAQVVRNRPNFDEVSRSLETLRSLPTFDF